MSDECSVRLKEFIRNFLKDREVLIGSGTWEMFGNNFLVWEYCVNGTFIDKVKLNIEIVENVYTYINNYNDAEAYCSVIKFKLDNHRVREINISNTKKNLKFIDRLKKEIQKNANV